MPAGDSRWNEQRGKIRFNPDPLLPPRAAPFSSLNTGGWGGRENKKENPPRNTKQNTRRGTTSSLWPRGCALGQGQVAWGERGAQPWPPGPGSPSCSAMLADTNYFLADILARVYILRLRVPAGAQQYGWQGADSSEGWGLHPLGGLGEGGLLWGWYL